MAADMRRGGLRPAAVAPPELAAAGHLDGLLRAMAQAPRARELAALWLRLAGLEALAPEQRAPGSFWSDSGRLGREGDHLFDTWTGAPLYLRLPRAGALLAWVPPGEVPRDDGTAAPLARGFWLGVHPVTRGEYHALTGMNTHAEAEDMPASFLSFPQATHGAELAEAALCGGQGAPPGWSLRLPSELEWRRAAGAPPEGRLTRFGWFKENAPALLVPVGRLPANPLGLHDTFGNVQEWVLDRWGCPPEALPPGGEPHLQGGHPGERVLLGGDTALPAGRLRGVPRRRGVASLRGPGSSGLRLGLFPPPGLDHPGPAGRAQLMEWLRELAGRGAEELVSVEDSGRFRRSVEAVAAGDDPGAAAALLGAFGGDGPTEAEYSPDELGAWRTGRLLYPAVGRVARDLPPALRARLLGELLTRANTALRVRVLELDLPLPELRPAYRAALLSPTPAERAAAARCLRRVPEASDARLAAQLLGREQDRRVRSELAALASRPGAG